jgi:hypothetical protein
MKYLTYQSLMSLVGSQAPVVWPVQVPFSSEETTQQNSLNLGCLGWKFF